MATVLKCDARVYVEMIKSARWIVLLILSAAFLSVLIVSGYIKQMTLTTQGGAVQLDLVGQDVPASAATVQNSTPQISNYLVSRVRENREENVRDVTMFLLTNQWKYNNMRELTTMQICIGLQPIRVGGISQKGERCRGQDLAATEEAIQYLYEIYMLEHVRYAKEQDIIRHRLSRLGRDVADVYRLDLLREGAVKAAYFENIDLSKNGFLGILLDNP